jgi:hypothetical protein
MDRNWRGHNTKTLWLLILIGIAYSSLLRYEYTLTGTDKLDSIIGVVLGLYICSHPAANLVNMIFFWQSGRQLLSSRRSAIFWLALNMLILLVGWVVIFLGTTRLVGRAG